MVIRYTDNGCQVVLPSTNGEMEKHEEVCEFQPYPCVIMSCDQKVLLSTMPSHLKSFHSLDWRSAKGDYHRRAFRMHNAMSVPWSAQWSQWKGSVIEHDGCHFYLGLVRMGDMWTASVHLIGSPGQVSEYKVEIVAKNPKKKSRHLSYNGPVNSLLIAGEDKFRGEIAGLVIPDRLAEALINKHSWTKKEVLGILCKITKTKCF